jgi:hypothetical protein
MKKNIILWLSFAIVFTLTLHSCVHDEISSSSDPSSKEYHSKSLWKEDEVYIKNVMKVYFEHESEIKKRNGIPLWDYAMTMGYANESFLIVPVAEGNKIVSCIQVPRNGDNISFMYENDLEHIKFFQGYTTLKNRKPLKLENFTSQSGRPAQVPCKISSVSMWYPDDEYGANGHWETHTVVTCPPEPIDGEGGETNPPEGPTYPYPGGGNSQPQQPKTPCEKTKALIDEPRIKDSLNALKAYAQTSTKKERGFQELKSGGVIKGNVTADNQMFFGIGQSSLGTVHTHQPGTIGIFAPRDIMTFLDIVRAQDANALGNAYSGTVSSVGTYFINFTGTASDLPPDMTDAEEEAYVAELVTNYVDFNKLLLKKEGKGPKQNLSNSGLEKLFNYLTNTMGLSGKITLIKEENGNTSTIEYNPDGTPKTLNPC